MPDDGRSVERRDCDQVVLRRAKNGNFVFIRDPEGEAEEVAFRTQDRLLLKNLPREFRRKYQTARTVECLYLVSGGQAGIFIPCVPGAGCNVVISLAELVVYEKIIFWLLEVGPIHLPSSAFDCVIDR